MATLSPLIIQLKNKSNGWKILSAALVVVIIFLFTCKGKKPVNAPVLTTVTEQKKDNAASAALLKRVHDSADKVITQLQRDLKISDDKLVGFIRDYGTGEREIDNTLAQEVPDTCRELQIRLTDQFNQLKRTSAIKDREFGNKISTLQSIGTEKDRQLKADSVFQAEQKRSLDTCWANQQRLEKYTDKIKPKRSVYAGVTGMGSQSKIYEGLGVNLGLENRKGTKYEIGAMQFAGSIHYTIGVKKTIFKF